MRRLAVPSLLAAVLALAAAPAPAAGLVVIVSSRSQVAALRADQVADIFLGQNAHFPDGADAVALDQDLASPLRNEFYARVAAKSPALLKAYWSKMIFTGRGKPPREAHDSAEVRRQVAANPALIGYVDKGALDASVRAVLVIR